MSKLKTLIEEQQKVVRKKFTYHITQEDSPILTPDIVDETIAHSMELAYEAGKADKSGEIQKTANQIGECLEYCAVQNGRPDCKNCGLSLEMYQALTTQDDTIS